MKERQIKQGDMQVFWSRKGYSCPRFLLCCPSQDSYRNPPVSHSQKPADNSDKPEDFHLFYTHAHTPSKQTLDTHKRRGKNDPHLFLLVYTPMNHSAAVLSYFLPISQFQYLHFLHLVCRFSHSHMVKTTYTLTRMRKSTAHTQRRPLLPTHTFSLAGLPAGSRRSQMAQCVKSIR